VETRALKMHLQQEYPGEHWSYVRCAILQQENKS